MSHTLLKFGGSSVGSVTALQAVTQIIVKRHRAGERPVVVVSALQGVTDQLLKALASACTGAADQTIESIRQRHCDVARQLAPTDPDICAFIDARSNELQETLRGVALVREASARVSDMVVSFGERLSAELVAAIFREQQLPATALDARTLITTDTKFGAARVDFETTNAKIQRHFQSQPPLTVVTGFIGATASGETTTLGRGGSDYTASIVGAALRVKEIEIWTDVDGVLTADPRRVPDAYPVPQMSYEEAMELSHFGAKVIYPPTIQPAMDAGIAVTIKNTFNPEFPGTRISPERAKSTKIITGISSLSSVALFRVEGSGMVGVAGIASRLFGALAREEISIILISQASSEHSICFAIAPSSTEQARSAIEREFQLEIQARLIAAPTIETKLSIVAVVGEQMRHTTGVAGRMFQALGRNGVNVVAIAQGSSERNISAVVASSDESKALNALHDAFFLSSAKRIHLFLAGVGSIGSTLLSQIAEQSVRYREESGLDLRLAGVATSTRMLIDARGIAPQEAAALIKLRGTAGSIDSFVSSILSSNLSNVVCIDCTASDAPAQHYEELLRASVSIVTPNKRANSGSFAAYASLRRAAQRSNARFFYETNVGAGLPIINTMHDLIASGDTIHRIDAVLSGTLSFIFNSLLPGRRFSELVREAQQRGLTEPDPRDDLSGTDVLRKLLILGREMGLPLEWADVTVESLVPPEVRETGSLDDFYAALENYESDFQQRLQSVTSAGGRLRYIASVRGRTDDRSLTQEQQSPSAQVGVQVVGPENPFFGLDGTDNMIAFTTARYNTRPLVVRGPGAGKEVTAAGVLADILRVASYL